MNDTSKHMGGSMAKNEFAASFIQTLKHATRIATGKQKTAGSARELMNRLRAEVEEDKRERR